MHNYRKLLFSLTPRQKLLTGYAAALICEGIYGFSFYFTKTTLAAVSTTDLLAWRFTVAFLSIWVFYKAGVAEVRLPKKNRLPVLLLSFLFPCGYFLCETAGLRHTTTSEAAMLLAGAPIVALVLSSAVSRKLPTGSQIAGVAISFAGLAICILENGWETSLDGTGRRWLFAAVVLFSLYLVFSQTQHVSPATKTFLSMLVGVLFYDGAALILHIRDGNVADLLLLPLRDTDFLISILYLGVLCSVITLVASNVAVDMIGASAFTSFGGLETLITLIAGHFLLQESLSANQIWGAALIVIGVSVANRIGETLFGRNL